MGTFSNTKYSATIDSLVQSNMSKLNNPYYAFSDKSPTKVTYWKQNKPKTTLDQGSMLNYAHVSPQSAIKFNKIIDFYLYGIGNIPIDYDVGENGLEASAITGDCVILPNTIEPFPGDFFSISYIKEDLLFKVTGVTPNTLDSGSIMYKIEYQLELTNSSTEIDKQVVATFNFIVENVGTEFNSLITSTDLEFAEKLDSAIEQLRYIFSAYFYHNKVQTYVYKYDSQWFYDPCMIEFIRRNKLMGNTYIAHQTYVSHTFSLEYSRSFFNALEEMDKDEFLKSLAVSADLITEINSLFYVRIEDYYKIRYKGGNIQPLKTKFSIFDGKAISYIKDGEKFPDSDTNSIFNPLIAFLNKENGYIADSIIDRIHDLDCANSKDLFYLIPIYMYIIRKYINDYILSTPSNPSTIE